MADLDHNVRIRQHIAEAGGKVPTPAEAAQHAIDMIEGRIERRFWDQRTWIRFSACRTACCVAGDVALQTEIVEPDDGYGWDDPVVGGHYANEAAQAILDLTKSQATCLFSGDRTKKEVLACLEQIVNGTVPDKGWGDDDDAWNDDEWEDNGRP